MQGAGTTFGTEPAGAATYGPGATGVPQVYHDPPLGSSTFEPFHHPVRCAALPGPNRVGPA
jgi:hypothetical protein